MKKLLSVLIVLAIATVANATLTISVDGIDNPPDTTITLAPSGHAVIDIHSTLTPPQPNFIADLFADGCGTLDASKAVMEYLGSLAQIRDIVGEELDGYKAGLAEMGYLAVTSVIELTFADGAVPPLPLGPGRVVDKIDFHCEGLCDVTLVLMNADTYDVFDTQIIHQIPEPASMLLLGLGGLLLRRRK